jgi:hypothetical protein
MMPEPALKNGEAATEPIRISKKRQLLYTFVIFVVFLVLLEGVLRILGIPADLQDLRTDPGLVKERGKSSDFYTPGWSGYQFGAVVHINSKGWRGREFAARKPDGTIRILGVGDSFTYGRAVNDEDVFLVKLEEMLNADADYAAYETINSAREGVNTAQELKIFKKRDVLSLEPDLVVLGFTVHNDAELKKKRPVYRNLRRGATPALKLVGSDGFGTLADTFRLARILRLSVRWAYRDELNEIYYNLILENYRDGSESWENCRRALEGFYNACREKKTPLIFVIFPVYPMETNQTFKEYPDGLRNVHEKLASVFSNRAGVTVVDSLDDLAASGLTTRESMVVIDRHPNARWHEIVAGSLYEAIKGLGLKPQPSMVERNSP